MTVKQAHHKLAEARRLSKLIRYEIKDLRQFIIKKGGNPDPRKSDLIARNKEMYKLWKDGKNFAEIGKEYKLSSGRVGELCRIIDKCLETNNSRSKAYKDLLPYK